MRVIIPSETPSSATFTRATTATYLDEAGLLMYSAINQPRYQDGRLLLEGAATNLLLRSQEADNAAAWQRSAGPTYTITANTTTAPDGNMTADTVRMSSGGSSGVFQYVTVTAVTSYTFSWWAMRTSSTVVNYRVYDDTNNVDIVASTSYYASINASTWVRMSVTFTTPAACTSVRVYVVAGHASLEAGAIVWGMQLELGTTATSYIPTTTAQVPRSADVLTGEYLASTASTSVGLPIEVLPEDSVANLWVSGTTYAVGVLAYRTGTHRVYRRLVAGAGTTPPESDPTNWRDVRSTTRWTPLVATEDTLLLVTGNLYFSLAADGFQGLYLGGLVANSVRVVVVSSAGVVRHDETQAVPSAFAGWLSNNEPSLFIDLSNRVFAGDRIDITLIGATDTGGSVFAVAGLRYLVAGFAHDLGVTLAGARLGITDFSRRETDEFGTTTFVQRKYAKRLNVDLVLPTPDLSRVFQVLAELRANVALWVPGTTSELGPLAFFGWCKDFGITVAYARHSTCALEIEGVV